METGIPILDIEERETYSDRPDSFVLTTKMPLRDAADAIVRIFGISHDITKRKLLELKNQILLKLGSEMY
jgi:hypothetical protein